MADGGPALCWKKPSAGRRECVDQQGRVRAVAVFNSDYNGWSVNIIRSPDAEPEPFAFYNTEDTVRNAVKIWWDCAERNPEEAALWQN